MKHLSKSALLGLGLAVTATIAQANALQIIPVHIKADSTVKTGSIELANPGQDEEIYQVTVLRRSQVGGKDVLTPTDDILATPAMMKLAGGEKRALRFMRMNADPTQGQYYIIELQELPQANGVEKSLDAKHSLSTKLIFTQMLPIGFEPAKAPPAHLTAHIEGSELFIGNDGGKMYPLNTIGLVGQKPWKNGALGWILPSGGLSYKVPATVGQTIELSDGVKSQTVVVQ